MSKPFLDRVKRLLATDNAAQQNPIHIAQNTAPLIVNAQGQQDYLAGQMLIATPVINNGCFQRAVVYVFAHSDEGAMGVIINQPLDTVHFSSLVSAENLPKEALNKELPVYYGGPVDRGRGFVLHSTDYAHTGGAIAHNGVGITASSAILHDIIAGIGPRNAFLLVGCAGWGPGQLEQEIEHNSWINMPVCSKLVFHTENDIKWASSSKLLGVDMNFFSTTVGHA
jgi:putative transcriptional regulator